MDNVRDSASETCRPLQRSKARSPKVKVGALMLLVVGLSFLAAGCIDDRYYGGRRSVHGGGYYASYGAPAPYYYDDGYGYHSRGDYGRYRSSGYRTRSGYVGLSNRYSDYGRREHRRWDRHDGDRRRRGEYRRRDEGQRSRTDRRQRRDRRRAVQSEAEPEDARPVETQPE